MTEEEAERCRPRTPSVPFLSEGPKAPELPVFWRPKRLEKGASSGGTGLLGLEDAGEDTPLRALGSTAGCSVVQEQKGNVEGDVSYL